MARYRSRQAETEDVNERRLRRGAVNRQHLTRWAVGHDELAPGVVGDTHLHPTALETIREIGGASGVGQLLVVSATGDSFASGGDYVTADTIVYQHGFEEVSAAGDQIVWPIDAVGEIQVELAWDTYTGGGTIEIEVDGTVPAWGLIAQGTVGAEGCKRRGVHIAEGSVVKVKVTQSSGSAKTGDVLVEFSIPDPTLSVEGQLDLFWVDSKVSAGSSSTVVLESGVPYRVVVTGNWRDDDTTIDEGAPDDILFPSPGEVIELAAQDAETVYASPTPGSYPVHNSASFEMDSGAGFSHVEPVGGSVSTPTTGHVYEYAITGTGVVLAAKIVDSIYTNNNGMLRVDIYRAVG